MSEWTAAIRARLAELGLEPTREAEITEELALHLEDRYRETRAAGATEAEARALALAELADPRRLADRLRPTERRSRPQVPLEAESSRPRFGGLGGDLRYAFRALRRNPGFTLVAVVSLALGSGANVAVFRLLDALRLRSLPLRAPAELVDVKMLDRKTATGSFSGLHPEFTFALWERIRDRQRGLSGTYAWGTTSFNLSAGGPVRNVEGIWVSGGFFGTLGVQPAVGRLLGSTDDAKGCAPAAVLSHRFWLREYGGDAAILQRTVRLDQVEVPIVGVTQPSFFGVEVGRRFDIALPLCAAAILRPDRDYFTRLDAWWLAIGGRLAPGVTAEQVSTQLRAISPALLEETMPPTYVGETARAYRSYHLGVEAGGTGRSKLRTTYASSLWLLLGIGGMVLLIACANVANLLLARGSAREREIAARLALGASRGRILRHLLVESFLIAAAGVGVGAVLSQALTHYLVATLTTADTPLFLDLAPDGRLFLVTALVAVATCLGFGLGPALRSTRTAPAGALRAAGRGTTGSRSGFRAHRVLVVAQVALSMVLVIAALLFGRSFRNLLTSGPGFRLQGIAIAELDFSTLSNGEERHRTVGRELLEQVRRTPGVEAAAATTVVPFQNWWNEDIRVTGADGSSVAGLANFSVISDGYFGTLDIPRLAGRDFGAEDRLGAPASAIVNSAFARKFFAGSSPIGRTLGVVHGGVVDSFYRIVGLVGDTRYVTLRDDFDPVVFLPVSQSREVSYTNLLVRAARPAEFLATLERMAVDADPAITVRTGLLEPRAREGIVHERIMATLSGYFGLLALGLATIGLYGVLAYLVARRTNEVGLRMALGADRRRIVGMIVGESIGLTVAGLALGTVLTISAIKLSTVTLFGLTANDPTTFVLGVAVLAGAALLAGYLPGRKAARVDPMAALRAE